MKLIGKVSAWVALLAAGLAHAQSVTFDPATNMLRVPSIQVGNVIYSNLVYRVDAGQVISVGVAQNANAIADSCSGGNITLANLNAVQLGMSMEQVQAVIGCRADPIYTVRSQLASHYTWMADGNKSITVYFDPAGTLVTSASPTVVYFKFSSGI